MIRILLGVILGITACHQTNKYILNKPFSFELKPIIIPDSSKNGRASESFVWLKTILEADENLLLSDKNGISINIISYDGNRQAIGVSGDMFTVLENSKTLLHYLNKSNSNHTINGLHYETDSINTPLLVNTLRDSMISELKKKINSTKKLYSFRAYSEETAPLATDGILLFGPKNSQTFIVGIGRLKRGKYKVFATYFPTFYAFNTEDDKFDLKVHYPKNFKSHHLVENFVTSDTINFVIN